MPGIFGFFLKEPAASGTNESLLKVMIRRLHHKEGNIVDTFFDLKAGLGRSSLGVFNRTPQPVFYRGCYLCMDGYVDNLLELKNSSQDDGLSNPELSPEEAIIRLFLLHKANLPSFLKGIFNIVIYDSNEAKLYIFCDRYGVLPLYFTITPKGFYFAPEIKALTSVPESDSRLNESALVNFLTAGIFVGEETLFEKINLFPYGSQFVIDSALNIKKMKYWEYPPAFNYNLSEVTPALLEEGTERLRQAVGKYFKNPDCKKIGVTLSGGMDSRTICAFGSQEYGSEIDCFHVKLRPKEARIAKAICKKLNGKWHLIDFKDIDWNAVLETGCYLSDGHLVFTQHWLMSILPHVRQVDLILDGAVMDHVCRLASKYPLDDDQYPQLLVDPKIKGYEDAYNFIIKSYWPLSPSQVSLFFNQIFCDKIGSFRENIIEHLKKFPTDDLGALSQYFYFTTRGRRFVWPQPLLNRNFVEIGFPGFDYDMFDFGTSLPVNLLMEARLYRAILLTNFPELGDIPWATTGLPLTKYQTSFSKLKNRIRSYDYSIKRLTKYKLGFQKADWGYRFVHDPNFRQPILKVLLDKKTLNRGHVTKEGIEQLIKYQQEGKAPFSLIERLTTVELFYRMFMD